MQISGRISILRKSKVGVSGCILQCLEADFRGGLREFEGFSSQDKCDFGYTEIFRTSIFLEEGNY